MDFIATVIDFILHIDVHLHEISSQYGSLIYPLLFIIIFCETGLVVTPFLPGDSLLFVVGALSATGAMNLELSIGLLLIAAILGDTVNYHMGKFFGVKIYNKDMRFIKKEHLIKTHNFYEKHGGKTIIIARFMPIIRTFAPFVAGAGTMHYGKFISYNVIGAFLWVMLFIFGGYFFGNIQVVKNNFSIVIIAIIIISILPGIISYFMSKVKANKQSSVKDSSSK
jgi:membrane-associated protein